MIKSLNYENKAETVMVNNSTNINKMYNGAFPKQQPVYDDVNCTLYLQQTNNPVRDQQNIDITMSLQQYSNLWQNNSYKTQISNLVLNTQY